MTPRATSTIKTFAALMVLGAIAAGGPLLVLAVTGDGITSLTGLTGLLVVAYGVAAARIWMLASQTTAGMADEDEARSAR